MTECCVTGFQWDGIPAGTETALAQNKAYVTGSTNDVAIILIHDLFGWTFENLRILADHYAQETPATVYLPDFFGGEVLPSEIIKDNSRWREMDVPGLVSRNTKEIRQPEIFECAKALRSKYKRVAAVGFCFGGWAVFRLDAKGNNLVDCISTAHLTFLEKNDIEKIGVPVQIMAPEFDKSFTPELKEFANKIIPTLGVPYDYQYFPGVEHAFASRGNQKDEAELKAMVRAKKAAVNWFQQWLLVE